MDSLDDIMRRLEAAPQTPTIQQIAGRALAFRRVVAKWDAEPPTDAERWTILQKVLGMHVELMEAGIQSDDAPAPSSGSRVNDSG